MHTDFLLNSVSLKSTVYDSDDTYNQLRSISDSLHHSLFNASRLVYASKNDVCFGSPGSSRYKIISPHLLDQQFIDYLANLRSQLLNSNDVLLPVESSSKYLLENTSSGFNEMVQKYQTELKLLVNFDGDLMRQYIDLYLGPYLREFCHSHYRITDVRPFHTSIEINSGRNTNNKLHTDGGPTGQFKAIIYLSDVTIHNGPFCVRPNKQLLPITAPSGTVILFDNTSLSHTSLQTFDGSRDVLMLEFIPSLSLSTSPLESTPLNARQLLNPFLDS